MIKPVDVRGMRQRRHRRIRMKLSGTPERPRVSVFRSSEHIYAQIIDDTSGRTLVAASSLDKDVANVAPAMPPAGAVASAPAKGEKGVKPGADKSGKQQRGKAQAASNPQTKNGKKTLLAHQVGTLLAKRALEKGIKTVVFDRGGYLYHGRIKALAESARTAGLEF